MKKFIMIAFLCSSASSFAMTRIPNKCWNTMLSQEARTVCDQICSLKVEDEYDRKCAKAQVEVDQCFEDFNECAKNGLYPDVLTTRDNCETQIVNECFMERFPSS